MPDYNLAALSSRTFEQLVQAISLRVIGSNVTIFGDGPDGGREATFEHSDVYPSRERPWNEYGVIQAKFLQLPKGHQANGRWLLSQLDSEMRTYKTGRRKRLPKYYILATNVHLTAVDGRGTKDQVWAALKTYAEEIGIIDVDIWDDDKICRFLDDTEDIRKAYAAWITPGDVLAAVLETIGLPPDFDAVLTRYLGQELLRDQYVNLEQAGHQVTDAIPLARVLVDLPARPTPPPLQDPPGKKHDDEHGIIRELLVAAGDKLDAATESESSAADMTESLSRQGRYLLIGGPGQGKSTVGQYLCQLFRAAILQQRPPLTLTPQVRSAIAALRSCCRDQNLSFPPVRRFPVRIELMKLADAIADSDKPNVRSILTYIIDRIEQTTDYTISISTFRRWLASYPWLIVLDGLDEVPLSSNRHAIVEAVQNFWIEVFDARADIMVLATTRPQGYNKELNERMYNYRWLVPLSSEWVDIYASKLAASRYHNDREKADRVIGRLRMAASEETTARLMTSPLQITIMAALVERMGKPPEQRWSLFNEYYNVIYMRELERGTSVSTILRDHRSQINTIHRRLGLVLHLAGEGRRTNETRRDIELLDNVVHQVLSDEGYEGEELSTLSERIRDAATDRLVFIVGLHNTIGFEIRSLQEFMAAEALMDGGDDLVGERLRAIAPISHWRNVFLFAAGKCYTDRQHLRDTIYAICAELNETDEDCSRRLTLLGSRLAGDVLLDGAARSQPRHASLLLNLAFRLLELPENEYYRQLAYLYRDRHSFIYQNALSSPSSSTNELMRWLCLLALDSTGLEWVPEIIKSQWPSGSGVEAQLLNSIDLMCASSTLSDEVPAIIKRHPAVRARTASRMLDARSISVQDELFDLLLLASYSWRPNPLYLTLALSESASLQVEISSIDWSEEQLAELPSIDVTGPMHPSWRTLLSALDFIREPCASTLANAIAAAEDVSDERLGWNVESWVPWPLASCLGAMRNQLFEGSDLVRAAEDGLLGDYDDWIKTEERWQSHGLEPNDIQSLVSHELPLSPRLADAGFPFWQAYPLTPRRPWVPIAVLQLIDLHRHMDPSWVRSAFANWIINIGPLAIMRQPDRDDHYTVDRSALRGLVEDVFPDDAHLRRTPTRLRLDILSYANWNDDVEPSWIDILDRIGRSTANLLVGRRRDSQLLEFALRSYMADPQRVGLLPLLASSYYARIPSDMPLAIEASDSNRIRIAKTALRVRRSQNATEMTALAREMAALFSNGANPDDEVFAVPGLTGPIERHEAYLCEFFQLTKLMPWIQQRLFDQLVFIGDAKRSALGRRLTWQRLGLPSALFDAYAGDRQSPR